jgi:hypothetical protein
MVSMTIEPGGSIFSTDRAKEVLDKFRQLEFAAIDTSSILYCHKAGFLIQLINSLQMSTIPEVIREVGFGIPGLEVVDFEGKSASTDQRLLEYSLEHGVPLFSEDKWILKQLERNGHSYFNALMALNFLLFRMWITADQYENYLRSLKRTAWYSEQVWLFGRELHGQILKLDG